MATLAPPTRDEEMLSDIVPDSTEPSRQPSRAASRRASRQVSQEPDQEEEESEEEEEEEEEDDGEAERALMKKIPKAEAEGMQLKRFGYLLGETEVFRHFCDLKVNSLLASLPISFLLKSTRHCLRFKGKTRSQLCCNAVKSGGESTSQESKG
jgi:hypothetical protein